MKDEYLIMIARSWTHQYTLSEVKIQLSESNYSELEKDKLLYYFNCLNHNGEIINLYQ